jgi:hypothetical protein
MEMIGQRHRSGAERQVGILSGVRVSGPVRDVR